jgi:hypothetical protein
MENKRDCESFEILLTGYHDGVLSPAEHRKVEQHLKDCADCSLALREMVRIGEIMRETLQEEVSSQDFKDFPKPIQSQVKLKDFPFDSPRGFSWKPFLFPSAVAAGALGVLLGFVLWFETQDQRMGPFTVSIPGVQTAGPEREKIQGDLGLGIRNYALLQFILGERERAYQEMLSSIQSSPSFGENPGAYQEDLGRTIRDFAFIRHIGTYLGGTQQEVIGKGIRDMAKIQYLSESKT